MKFRYHSQSESQAIVQLFACVFLPIHEGEAEGTLIGRLAADLFENTSPQNLFNFVAEERKWTVTWVDFLQPYLRRQCSGVPVSFGSEYTAILQRQRDRSGVDQLRSETLRRQAWTLSSLTEILSSMERLAFARYHPRAVVAFVLSYPEGWLGQSLLDELANARRADVRAWKPSIIQHIGRQEQVSRLIPTRIEAPQSSAATTPAFEQLRQADAV
ncbi:MAG: hypothetical protein R2856_08385 [Caldilineaceae bacterium]